MLDEGILQIAAAGLLGGGCALFTAHGLADRQRWADRRRLALLVGDPLPLEPEQAPAHPATQWVLAWLTAMQRRIASSPSWMLALVPVAALLAVALGPAPALALGVVGAALILVSVRGTGFRAQIERQAPGAIQLMASGLRAGYSVAQALALVARESPEPTASQFAQVRREVDVGVALDEALRGLVERTANADYQLVAVVVAVQHQVGGNLAQTLDAVAETITERFELRRQVAALTAQQRLSALVLTLLPIGLFCFLWVTNRSFLQPMLTSPVGWGLLAAAAVLLVGGSVAMRVAGRVAV